MTPESTAKLKELVAPGRVVQFVKYKDGKLWYEVVEQPIFSNDSRICDPPVHVLPSFMFPVPIEDAKGADFLPKDRATPFMRWIRKELAAAEVTDDRPAEKQVGYKAS